MNPRDFLNDNPNESYNKDEFSPRDFLNDNPNESYNNKDNFESRDWLKNEEPVNENILKSVFFALPRIKEDLINRGVNFVKTIPEYYKSAKTELPGLKTLFKEHPGHALGQGAAGLIEQGHNILNKPRDVSEYIENRLHLLPKGFSEQIPQQKDITKDLNDLIGQPKYPGEKFVRGAGRNELLFSGIGNVASKFNPLRAINKINPEEFARRYQVSHDALLNSAQEKFKRVGLEVYRRNVSNIPLRQNLIADIAENLESPKTKSMNNLLDNAFSGDYNALRDLQSDLFKKANTAKNHDLQSEKNKGLLLHELRDEINDSITNHLTNLGHKDLADTLNHAKKQYKDLQHVYFDEKLPKPLRDLVDKDTRKIPNNISKPLSENSKPVNNVKAYNPFIEKSLEKDRLQKNALRHLKLLGKFAGYTSLAALILNGGKDVYDYLENKKE